MKTGINCGSGQRPFTSTPEVKWINVDSQARWKPDIVCDGASIPLESESADYVVLHHVLEHFGCGEGQSLIEEAYRLLEPGGTLMVFVPDLRALAIRWTEGHLNTQIYMTNLYGAYMGSPDDRHEWGFDADYLHSFLGSCCKWSAVRQIIRAPSIPGAEIAWDWWILGMEAIK